MKQRPETIHLAQGREEIIAKAERGRAALDGIYVVRASVTADRSCNPAAVLHHRRRHHLYRSRGCPSAAIYCAHLRDFPRQKEWNPYEIIQPIRTV